MVSYIRVILGLYGYNRVIVGLYQDYIGVYRDGNVHNYKV